MRFWLFWLFRARRRQAWKPGRIARKPYAMGIGGFPTDRERPGRSEQLLHGRRDLLGLGFVREVRGEAAVPVEHVDDRGMVHQVGAALLARNLLVVDAVGARGGGDVGRRASEADEGRAEVGDVALDQFFGV